MEESSRSRLPTDVIATDLRSGLRAHARAPLATAVAVAVLALGIAAASVSLAIVQAFFVRDLPIANSDRFVHVYRQSQANEPFPISFPDYEDVRRLTTIFDGAIAEAPAPLIMTAGAAEPERVWGELVSDDYFGQLGLFAQQGRLFIGPEDAVVLSDAFWRKRFGASRTVIGRTMEIEGRPYRVTGVAPAGFGGTIVGFSADLWLPLRAGSTSSADSPMRDDAFNRGEQNYFVLARLNPSSRIEQARTALQTLAARLGREYPDTSAGLRLTALTQSEGRFPTVRDRVFGASMLTIAVTVLIVLIACANIAGLLLARAADRRTDIAVRIALGASRGRIVSQLLAESTTIAVAAGAIGILLAWQTTALISNLTVTIARGATASVDVTLDARGLAISVALTLTTAILCGLTPALESLRTDVIESLRRSAKRRLTRTSRARNILLAGQVAVSMLLLAGGALFLRSFQVARDVDLGFSHEGVVTAAIDIRARGSGVQGNPFWTSVLDRVRALPGVAAAALTFRLPLELGITRTSLAPYPFSPPAGGAWPETEFSAVSPAYFSTVAITVLDGRDFTDRDAAGAPRTIILNDVLASRFWPGQRAVGRFVTTPEGERIEVIGVVRRSKYLTIGEAPTAYAYIPIDQTNPRSMTVVARTAGNPRAVGERIRETVRQLDATVTIDTALLSDRVRLAMAPATGSVGALGIVGLLAVSLTALGLFGAVAQIVSARTFEIGVRRALGAPDWRVASLVLSETAALVMWGLIAGIAATFAASGLLRSLLYEMRLADPLAFAVAPAVLLAVSAVAICAPTWRAVRISAASALRAD
jgi:predicted permease